jgi:hypothetical protein
MRRQPQPPTGVEVEIFPVSSSTDDWWRQGQTSNTLSTDENEVWNSGRFAPVCIRFEFEKSVRCTRVELLPCMSPESGTVIHEIRAGSDVFRFSGRAVDSKWINAEINAERIKSIDIQTLKSPSWVAWRRVRFWTTKY